MLYFILFCFPSCFIFFLKISPNSEWSCLLCDLSLTPGFSRKQRTWTKKKKIYFLLPPIWTVLNFSNLLFCTLFLLPPIWTVLNFSNLFPAIYFLALYFSALYFLAIYFSVFFFYFVGKYNFPEDSPWICLCGSILTNSENICETHILYFHYAFLYFCTVRETWFPEDSPWICLCGSILTCTGNTWNPHILYFCYLISAPLFLVQVGTLIFCRQSLDLPLWIYIDWLEKYMCPIIYIIMYFF